MLRDWTIRRARSVVGFTLIEMLVVISLITIVIAVMLPAIGRMIESANYASAVNTTSATLGNARALAMRNGRETGVVFLFDVKEERYTLMVVQLLSKGGSLQDLPGNNQLNAVAIAMIPAPGTAPIRLPKGTAVFGLSLDMTREQDMIDDETSAWYAGEVFDEETTTPTMPWLFPRNDAQLFVPRDESPWFDENGFLDINRMAVRHANSFCVLFDSAGSVVQALSAIPEFEGSPAGRMFLELPELPIDRNRAVDDDPLDEDPLLFDPAYPGETPSGTPNPEVVLGTVSQLAVVDLSRMSRAVGLREVWKLHPLTSAAPWPVYRDETGRQVDDSELDVQVREMSDWIDTNAKIISFDRYSGAAITR